MQAYTGPLPEQAWSTLEHVHSMGLATSSDLARIVAAHVALLASMGWITTITPDGQAYSRRWHITASGLMALQNKELLTSCSSH